MHAVGSGPNRIEGRIIRGVNDVNGAIYGTDIKARAHRIQHQSDRTRCYCDIGLRPRFLKDEDNQRLLDGIGLQHDRGRVLLFLHDPAIEPTNNRGEGAATGGDCAPAFSWFQE